MHTITTLQQQKANKQKIVSLALYDSTFSALAAAAGVEVILVGDSLGMVIQGHKSTLKVSLDDMQYHTRCVCKTSGDSLVIADMPFASYSNPQHALQSAASLMRAGAHMVKLEGGIWLQETIEHLKNNGIPVCGHIGLTPQSVHMIGGFQLQGKTEEDADLLTQSAVELERAGASLLVLECVPSSLAQVISHQVEIPVIGIGAGVDTDGQVLVIYDLIGISQGHTPRFVKNFMLESDSVEQAISHYGDQVRKQVFPAPEHSY